MQRHRKGHAEEKGSTEEGGGAPVVAARVEGTSCRHSQLCLRRRLWPLLLVLGALAVPGAPGQAVAAERVTICHYPPNNPGNPRTLTIGAPALPEHQAHGDFVSGPCSQDCRLSPVVCTASDQCHVAGTCNPSTGLCSNPAKPDGTTCDDGNAATLTDICTTGTCGQCVTSTTASPRFVANGDETITDRQTCVDTSVAGCGSGSPCIAPIFGPTAVSGYWSSTSLASFDALCHVLRCCGMIFVTGGLGGYAPGEWPPLRQAASATVGVGTGVAEAAATGGPRLAHC